MTQSSSLRTADVWRELLPEAVLVGGSVPWSAAAAVDHLGDPDGERVALLQGGAVMVPRLAAGHLRLTGGDRVAFVQGLISQDVAGCELGLAVDALLLDHRGQPQAGLMALRRAEDLYLAIEDGAADAVAAKLEAQIIFDDVRLERLDDRLAQLTLVGSATALSAALVSLWPALEGPLAAALERRAPQEGAPQEGAPPLPAAWVPTCGAPTGAGRSLLCLRPFGPWLAIDLHLLVDDLADAYRGLLRRGVVSVGERALTAGRVAFGLATPFAEGRLGLPQETGLEARVHYRKGCYLGQEIMARIEARGNLRRGLQLLSLSGPPGGLGVASSWELVAVDGAVVGEVVSAAPAADGVGWSALGVLRHDAPERAAEDGSWLLRVAAGGRQPRLPEAEVRAGLRKPPSLC